MFHEKLLTRWQCYTQKAPNFVERQEIHYYSFGPSDELVQTLPFEFVDNSKGGAYTKLPSNGWVIFNQNSHSHREIRLHQYNLWEV